MTRAMFATVLYRLAGEPESKGTNPFQDVGADRYYTDAVIWAYEAGIVKGISSTMFNPNGEITRQEMVTMLHRYAQAFGDKADARADLSGFPDADKVSGFAEAAMQWAVAEKIILGGADGYLKPTDFATRGEAVAVVCRFAGL